MKTATFAHNTNTALLTAAFVFAILSTTALQMLINPHSKLAGTDSYPAPWAPPTTQDSMFDTWGEYNRECTSYVSWMLHSQNGYEIPFYANAVDWKTKAQGLGGVTEETNILASTATNYIHFKDITTTVTKHVVGDWDNDGKTNPAVFRPSDGTWHWRTTSGGDATQQFGVSGDIPVPGYYSGSSVPDYAVYRPSNQTWYYRTQSGSVGSPQPFGLPGDIPVPGDYNGDSKTDYAIWRPSDGTWYWMPQGGAGTPQGFGLSGDLPTPGSFSGNAKEDFAVFRPSNSTWYWLPQGGSQQAQAFGLSGDIPAVSTLPYPILHSLGLL